MRRFMLDFIALFAPHLTPELVRAALAAGSAAKRERLFADIALPSR